MIPVDFEPRMGKGSNQIGSTRNNKVPLQCSEGLFHSFHLKIEGGPSLVLLS